MPVSSYAPELLELFCLAAQKRIVLELPNEKAAQTLRFRLHNLRKELRKERHELMNLANGVIFRVQKGEGEIGLLIAAPADDEFLPELRKAGITVEAPEPIASEPEPPISTGKGQAALQRFLDGEKQ
jgi:hypothetical protein